MGQKDRGNYPRQKLINAVLDVISEKLSSAGDAHKKYKIPARTIRRWVKYVMSLIMCRFREDL